MKETSEFLRVPVISVTQPVGQFFLCSIAAKDLLKVTYSIPASMSRNNGLFSKMWGNQRSKSTSRAKQIGKYIDETDSTFPNSIILSANYFEDGSFAEEEAFRWQIIKEENGLHYLVIPTSQPLASIIDGQHRLEGFKNVEKSQRLDMEIPCAVFINLPRAYQAKIFATININQKRVDKSLAYQLFGYDLNESNADKWPPDMLGVYLARILEGDSDSPFKGHIKLALLEEDEPTLEGEEIKKISHSWEVSVACIVEGVIRLISEKPTQDRSDLASGAINSRAELPMDNAVLRQPYINGLDQTILNLIIDYFNVVETLLWQNQPQNQSSFITKTVGVLALFDLLRDGIKAQKIDISNIKASASNLLKEVSGINFSDDFFHASGAGRVRIKNVLKHISGLSETEDPNTLNAIDRLIKNRSVIGTK